MTGAGKNRERWPEIEALYHAVLELPPGDRQSYLSETCPDEELRHEVESLLAEGSETGFFDQPAWQAAAPFLADSLLGEPADGRHNEERFPPGTILGGRYRIVALLGRGGMGEVYRASDLVLGQNVALKFLPESLTQDSSALNRLYTEVRLARQISHPNVCRVYDIAESEGLRFITMEYIQGENLRSLMHRIGRLPAKKAVEIACKLCAGLAAAHSRGVIHRDLKPANIMIDAEGNVRITDFGLAVAADHIQHSEPGGGTPAYMAPEQKAGRAATVQSDLYALGLILCELFGGSQRDTRGRPAAFLDLAIDAEIERAVVRCLEPDPRNRPSSAAMLAAELSGGDALLAATVAGETPVPELVALAGSAQGLPVRVANSCLLATFGGLILFTILASRIGVLNRLPVEPADALELIARNTLASVGFPVPVHRIGRFGYDFGALRTNFGRSTLYFWYRESPYAMVPNGREALVTPEDPPADLPGMVTTKWDGTGQLLSLRAAPSASSHTSLTTAELWNRLFSAAGLSPARFKPAEPFPIAAPGWDARASWIATDANASQRPLRVEAAAWRGGPVYFEVRPAGLLDSGLPPQIRSARFVSLDLVFFFSLLITGAVLAWRHMKLGRGDRQGAFRLAGFIFVTYFVKWAFEASHVPEVREFTLVFQGAWTATFWAAYMWTLYLALEPFLRRRWPQGMISWTRLLSGKINDPLVGGDVLIGVTCGTAVLVLITAVAWLSGSSGLRFPSPWMLLGAQGTLAHVLEYAQAAIVRGLSLLFLTFLFKTIFRNQWLAGLGTVATLAAAGFAFEVPLSPLPPAMAVLTGIPISIASVYLVLRKGLLAVIFALFSMLLLITLPLSANFSAAGTQASIPVVFLVAALAFFGFRSTLAKRPVF